VDICSGTQGLARKRARRSRFTVSFVGLLQQMKVSIDTRDSVHGPRKRETVVMDKELGFRIIDEIILYP